jgi:large subunit ribosomal protein L7/L12
MAIERAEIVDYIKNLSVLELSELIKELEETLGVSAAAVAVAAPAGGGGGGGAEAEEEQTEFDVVLVAAGDKKIKAIKVVRELTGLGLKEAKTFVEEAPKTVKEGLSKADAEEMAEKFRAVGASVEIK